jgi:hypothetical protein
MSGHAIGKIEEKTEFVKNVENDKIENDAGPV